MPLLLEDWNTPFGIPPFQDIEDEHFLPAFEEAMRRHRKEIDGIANNSEPATFANTIEAMERAGRELQKVAAVFFNLASADSNDERQHIEREIGPKLSTHGMAIWTDLALFKRIDALFETKAGLGLTDEQAQLLEDYHKAFVRAGARLDESGKARLTEIDAGLSKLNTAFAQNVLADEKSYRLVLDNEDDLKGLPDFVRQAAAEAASERDMAGRFVITLARASIEPFLEFSERRDLREKIYQAYIARGESSEKTDNRPIVREILSLRAEQAKILGYENYAKFQIADTMAKTPAAARDLLQKVWRGARQKALEEQAALQSLMQLAGQNEALAAWDWHHYAERYRGAKFSIDGTALKPFFELNNMIEAAFDTAGRLFALRFRERRDIRLYHPDVRAWEVVDSSGKTVALFVGDYFHRSSKRSGAWMTSFRKQERLDGEVLPIIVNVMNFTKGASGSPSLLSLDDARTLFHEFGHGLHGLLSDVTYHSLSGTSVDRDFVELPSQLFENWLLQPAVLKRFARHSETGEPIPDALLEKIHAARKFNQGFATVEYTASALFDLEAHEAEAPDEIDVEAFESSLRSQIGVPDSIALRHRPPHFQHIFAGSSYAAGYYTYLWAEVMEADAFKAFEEAGDVFDAEVADRLKRYVYSSGGTMKPDEAYRAFRGRDPVVEPLLEKRGL